MSARRIDTSLVMYPMLVLAQYLVPVQVVGNAYKLECAGMDHKFVLISTSWVLVLGT